MTQSALYAAIMLDELFEASPSSVTLRASEVIGRASVGRFASRASPASSVMAERTTPTRGVRERVTVHFGPGPPNSPRRMPVGAAVYELQSDDDPLPWPQPLVLPRRSRAPAPADDTAWGAAQGDFADVVGTLLDGSLIVYRVQWPEPIRNQGTFDRVFQDCLLTATGLDRLQQPCSDDAVRGRGEITVIDVLQRRVAYGISDEALARIIGNLL